jgi:hypothetical protein
MSENCGIEFNRHQWLQEVMKMNDIHYVKLHAVALWKFADSSGFCYPNQEQIIKAIGLKSTSRTSATLRDLGLLGFIQINYVQGNGQWKSANYQLTIPTNVGSNSPLNTNHFFETLKSLKNNRSKKRPTPTPVGVQVEIQDDYVVDGKDTRPPPPWAVN